MRITPIFVAIVFILISVAFGTADAATPNVVVFLVDDMGWQETSVPFHTEVTKLNERYRTPSMERLAAEGMKFTQAYASAVCSPSRISLLSGMNVARHRVTNWTLRKDRSPDQPSKFIEPPQWNVNGATTEVNVERATRITPLPALLKAVGYRTIHAGKAHFGAQGTPGEDPRHFGFDVNIAGHAAGGPGSYWGTKGFSAAWRKESRIWDVPGLEAYHGQEVYLTEAITREAITAVERAVAEEKPFFLYLSHYAIHAPWEKDPRFYERYVDAGLKPFEATLASMIEGMDKSLGDVMDALERLGVDQNTVVLFVSDNGAPAQCPRNLPLRGHKITPYEGGVRVPMIVKWPGVTKPSSVDSSIVVIDDFFPTILDLAGVTKPETVQQVDGKSFVPILRGVGKTAAERAFIWHYPHQYSGTPFSSVRQGAWKLIYHHITRNRELFNLNDDISEATDLASTRPDKVDELARVLGERLRAMDAQMPTDKETRQPIEWPDCVVAKTGAVQPVDVYLLGGQSNMQGIGQLADLPSNVPKAIPHTFFWNGQRFEPLVLGSTKVSARSTDFGPEVGFGLGMATADRPAYLIKYCASGMALHHGWHGGQWVGGEPMAGRRNFYPGTKPDDTTMGTLYATMKAQFRNGMKHLREQGFSPSVRGFVWMQGEQDAKHEESAGAYAVNLSRLRRRLAEDMGCGPGLPLVFGQVLPHEPPAARFTHRAEIRRQMEACDHGSGKAEAMPNTSMISTDRCSLVSDNVHYDAAGQLELGKALATALQDFQKKPLRVMTFNILQGGGEAKNVGFDNALFGGSRLDELAAVIKLAGAHVVGVQEDCGSEKLLAALGDGWHRIGSVYSQLPLTKVTVDPFLTVVEVELPGDERVEVVNCHWFPPKGRYGPDLAQAELKMNPGGGEPEAMAKRIAKKCAVPHGARGYDATLQPLVAAIRDKKPVILTGDFNEPSHLDWTARYAKEGSDRWVANPTSTPLRLAVEWPGSMKLAHAGLIDSYRAVHADEIRNLGTTWTPMYPNKTPGRRPYGEQVLDRIDRIYHAGKRLRPVTAEVVGENIDVADIVYDGRWPSDHRAVVVSYELE